MANQHPRLIAAIVALICGTGSAAADLLIDDFSTDFAETFMRSRTQTVPVMGSECSTFGVDDFITITESQHRCASAVTGVAQDAEDNMLGNERDIFMAMLGRAESAGTETLALGVGDGALGMDLSTDAVGYVRIEWDGVDGLSDDTATLTNNTNDLDPYPGGPGPERNNPFYTPDTVENLDEFFGRPRLSSTRPEDVLIADGIDNDEFIGKLDHSTVESSVGLSADGRLDLTEGNGSNYLENTSFVLEVERADIDTAFRFTVYSDEFEASHFSGTFSGPVSISARLSDFVTVPTQTAPNSNNPTYTEADFTNVTAIVFELFSGNSADISLSLLATRTTLVPAPSVPLLLLIGALSLLICRAPLQLTSLSSATFISKGRVSRNS